MWDWMRETLTVRRWHPAVLQWALVVWSLPRIGLAGPPFITDDPEPVAHHHWEFYLASQAANDVGGWTGTGPHVEVNYGVVPNLQLHVIFPAAWSVPDVGPSRWGYGDTELGVKFRFGQEHHSVPQIGTFPLVIVPTGNAGHGLGAGQTQIFLPLWVQESWGRWTTYGGGGFWYTPGEPMQDHGFVGWEVQRLLVEGFTLGVEAFCNTPRPGESHVEVGWDLGAMIDVTEHHHILMSAGGTYRDRLWPQAYLAWQVTLGPD